MEAVKSFNSELSSLYEVKPPISKAKMTAITRGAIKAIKFYKHVVQSVEKFILKCKPEYKVPGLYVIDSIVRQSRHQFGAEKDVFAPRFAKNLQQTFINLFKCPPEDKSKIIRVLNLWQKNQVFQADVIQPLFDMADPNNPIYQQIQQEVPVQQSNGGSAQSAIKGSPALQRTPTKANQVTDGVASSSNLTEPVLHQLQQLQRLLKKSADAGRPEQVHFNKKLLDFDYGDDEDEVNPSPRPLQQGLDSVANLLTNPEVLRQLQNLQSTIASAVPGNQLEVDAEKMKKLQEMKLQEDEFDKHLAQTVPNLPFASECEFKPNTQPTMIGGLQFIPPPGDNSQMSQAYDMSMSQHDNSGGFGSSQNSGTGNDVEVITLDHDDSHSPSEDRYKRKRSRSRSRDRRDKDRDRRRRSRSRSRGRRHRSRSRDRDRKDKDRKEREKESERDRERKKRGLPVIKKENLSVCSTTLWVGHLSKLVHQDDLSNTFGEFGEIVSIDLIPPRGCAFIVMHRRQDAARCLNKLKNHNLHGKAITLAWAPGKGVKGKDLKDYWESDLGVSYIPWNKIKLDIDLEMLEDGGMIDEETMPPWMQLKIEEMNKKKNVLTDKTPFIMGGIADIGKVATPTIDTSQPPPMPGTNLLQPQLLSLVNPFQYNNRLLGIMPNMANMANLPIGVPPPNMAPPMMPNIGLGSLNSPFQGPPGYVPSPLQGMENKPTPPPSVDANLRSLGESLMNLAGQSLTMPPLTMPPITQPPPPHNMEDNMDIEMEDAGHHDSKQNMNTNDPLQPNFGGRRDDGANKRDNRDGRRDDRGRRRSRSRDREQNRDRDSSGRDRDRRDRDRDFGRNRDHDRDNRDRRGNDRDRRWGGTDRRDGGDRRDGPHDRRDGFYDRREDQRDREKTLNDRLKEMAGMKFDEPPPNTRERKSSEGGTRTSSKDDISGKEETGPNESQPNQDEKNGDSVGFMFESPPAQHDLVQDGSAYRGPPPSGDGGSYGPSLNELPPFDNPPPFGPYGPDGSSYIDQGPPFSDGGYGPPDIMDSYGPGYGPDFGPGFDGPRSKRGGRRGRRGRGRDGPDFFPGRDEFGPPMIRGGPEFGPRGPPPLRGRGFFGPRGLRGRGGMPFREGPPGVFNPGFDGPPEFFRGPRGGIRPPFDDAFHRGRAGRFRGRGGRGPEGFEGPLPFGDGPPGLDYSELQEDPTPPIKPERTRSRWGNADENQDQSQETQIDDEKIVDESVTEEITGDGAGTPLRDEAIEDQPQIIEDYGPPGVDETSVTETAEEFEQDNEKEIASEPTESGPQDLEPPTEETTTENEG